MLATFDTPTPTLHRITARELVDRPELDVRFQYPNAQFGCRFQLVRADHLHGQVRVVAVHLDAEKGGLRRLRIATTIDPDEEVLLEVD